MIEIKIRNPNDERELDRALKKLKKIMDKEGVMSELRERRYFTKKSDKYRVYKKKLKREQKRRNRNGNV